jgi:hypothetical protein
MSILIKILEISAAIVLAWAVIQAVRKIPFLFFYTKNKIRKL